MKRILCYVAIVVCLCLIAIPPVFRAIRKPVEEEKHIPKIENLICVKDQEKIVTVYTDEEPSKIRYTFPNTLGYELNDTVFLKSSMENCNLLEKTNREGLIEYSLDLTNDDTKTMLGATFQETQASLKYYYKSKGFTCE